jgi:hypothetical protein
MKLVMVHGRAQAGKDPVALKKDWLDALSYGLERANSSLPAATTVEFPFYGDLLAELVKETETPLSSAINSKGPNPDGETELRGEIIAEIAVASGLSEDDIGRELGAGPTEKGPGNWEWVQAMLRAIDRVPGLNSATIDTFTRDVYVYLAYPGVRAQIDGKIADAINDEACVVLSHSLGTVVAYNVLYKRIANPSFPCLVTVGSPLGIKAIKNRIERPLRSPQCIQQWFNAYDDRDLVALVPLDARNFDIAPPIENKSDVKNFTDNRHGIEGYLADPFVARKVAEALKAVVGGEAVADRTG